MVLLVIGASSDMGMALIDKLHLNYDCVIAHYNHMNDKLKRLGEKLGEGKIRLVQADLSKEEEVIGLIHQVRDICECPSHIVHFPAPVCENSKFHKIKWDVFQSELDISLKSAVLILQAFLPQMAKKTIWESIVDAFICS